MSVSSDDAKYVAKLARLALERDDAERYAGQLSSILGHVAKISELDLADVRPTAHVLRLTNVFREDRDRPSLPYEDALANGPDVQEGAFRVPQILDTEE